MHMATYRDENVFVFSRDMPRELGLTQCTEPKTVKDN